MKNIYCTYFNKGYLSRGIVLFRSLERFEPDFTMEVLCFDDFTFDFLIQQRFKGVCPVRLVDFESRHPELVSVKPTRSTAEYFFTCTSNWMLDVLNRHPEVEMVTYLDADMRFFSSPAPIFQLAHDKDIIICSHNFATSSEKMLQYGKFNVGWVSFGNTETGRECLEKWARECREWCFDRLEDGKFGDQKYLDAWPERYGERLLVAPKSLDLGPWGVGKNELACDAGILTVEGSPLILYHYQGFRMFSRCHYRIGYDFHHSVVSILRYIYDPYVRELQETEREFGLPAEYGNMRVLNGNIIHRFINGVWLGWPRVSDALRKFQNVYYYMKEDVLGIIPKENRFES